MAKGIDSKVLKKPKEVECDYISFSYITYRGTYIDNSRGWLQEVDYISYQNGELVMNIKNNAINQ